MSDELHIKIDVVGHASPRWRGARSRMEAEHLNQELSEKRAHNVRAEVERILHTELPDMTIDVPAKGVGSHDLFPTASEDNAAVDRSVLVMVDLTTTVSTMSVRQRPPRKIYAATRLWKMSVLSITQGSGGFSAAHVRIKLQNGVTGHALTFSGFLIGGDLNPLANEKAPFNLGSRDVKAMTEQVGSTVTFLTDRPMDFDDWINRSGGGQSVRIVHAQLGVVRKKSTSFLQFVGVNSEPSSLVFELTSGWSLPTLDISVLAGALTAEGPNPGDHLVVKGGYDIVDGVARHPHSDGLLLSFPTGRSSLSDLAPAERRRLADFAANKARAIKTLLHYYKPAP